MSWALAAVAGQTKCYLTRPRRQAAHAQPTVLLPPALPPPASQHAVHGDHACAHLLVRPAAPLHLQARFSFNQHACGRFYISAKSPPSISLRNLHRPVSQVSLVT